MPNKFIVIVCSCLSLLNASCKKEAIETVMETKSECTYDERNTVKTFNNQQGTITFLHEQNMYTIFCGKPSEDIPPRILLPCNLPEAYKKDHLKVIFSGELKEVYETEYWLCQPFKLTKLKVYEN